jgi:DNA invertase Pin-like site-specific DNA recombinase
MRNVMHSMAEMQKRELVRRLRAGAEKKREHDARAYVGGRPPLGYRADASRELVIDPEGAAIVREVFGRARRGESVARITRGLNEREASGRRWHPTSVRRVLTNDIYKRARPGRIVDAKVWNAAQAALAARRKGEHERGKARSKGGGE